MSLSVSRAVAHASSSVLSVSTAQTHTVGEPADPSADAAPTTSARATISAVQRRAASIALLTARGRREERHEGPEHDLRLRVLDDDAVEEGQRRAVDGRVHELVVVDDGAPVREGDRVHVDAAVGDGDAGVGEDAGEGLVLGLVELAVVDDVAFVGEAAEDTVGSDRDDAVPFLAERGDDIEGFAFDVADSWSWG